MIPELATRANGLLCGGVGFDQVDDLLLDARDHYRLPRPDGLDNWMVLLVESRVVRFDFVGVEAVNADLGDSPNARWFLDEVDRAVVSERAGHEASDAPKDDVDLE